MTCNSCSHRVNSVSVFSQFLLFFSSSRLSIACVASFLLLACSAFTAAHGEMLQAVFDVASSGSGYDKYMELQTEVTYTGGVFIPYNTSACIKGNGAILDLQHSTIEIQGMGTRLDIDHCVIMNGGDPAYATGQGALNFVAGSGSVVSNTFYMNTVGIRIYTTGPQAVTVTNNIIVSNSFGGLLCQIGSEPEVSYNDCWGNTPDNYRIDCG